jgi:hypothetical protein
MARAGHSDCKTAHGYIDLAGVMFRREAERLEERLWGRTGTRNRYHMADSSAEKATRLMAEPEEEMLICRKSW